jgi:ADP-heptose:LPS heptosyltransferase
MSQPEKIDRRTLRGGKRKRKANAYPNPSPRMLEHNAKINARMRAVKELSGGAINPYRKGVFDGYTKATAEVAWKQARQEAKVIMKHMKENGMIDTPTPGDKYAEFAEEALEAAITIVRTPMNEQQRLAAARLVLDFTKSKPVAKNEVTVKTAEDWLQNVLEDVKAND